MLYGVRVLAESRGWSYRKALMILAPKMIRQYGPIAFLRRISALVWAYTKLYLVKFSSRPDVIPDRRQAALSTFLFEGAGVGSVLLVEAGDLGGVFSTRHAHTLVADQFVYFAQELDMPGQQWVWPIGHYESSRTAAVCCLRSYLPLMSCSVDCVVWLPRYMAIRASEAARTIVELARVLRPDGVLRIWLRPGGADEFVAQEVRRSGLFESRLAEGWLIARRIERGLPTVPDECPDEKEEPIIRVCVLPGSTSHLAEKTVAFLREQGISTICRRAELSGPHEHLADRDTDLAKPSTHEVRMTLRHDLANEARSATLIILVVNASLLELLGGIRLLRLREVFADGADWTQRVFGLIESDNEAEALPMIAIAIVGFIWTSQSAQAMAYFAILAPLPLLIAVAFWFLKIRRL